MEMRPWARSTWFRKFFLMVDANKFILVVYICHAFGGLYWLARCDEPFKAKKRCDAFSGLCRCE